MNIEDLQERVAQVFVDSFGRTPLSVRLDDIYKEVLELTRHTDLRNLREEAGDALASLFMLCNECGWPAEDLIMETLEKIKSRNAQYHSLGRKFKVAILGGAFNPVTLGHINVAQFVLDSSKTFDEVWLMPCYKHLHGKNMESPQHRLAMCELAAQVDGRIKVFDYEIENQLAGETFYFVTKLLDEEFVQDQYDFSIIIGQDNANTFDTWVNFEHLERMIRFVVVPRGGIKVDPKVNWYLKPPHIYLQCERKLTAISSTEVRDLLASEEETALERLEKIVDPAVLEYIKTHHLYGV